MIGFSKDGLCSRAAVWICLIGMLWMAVGGRGAHAQDGSGGVVWEQPEQSAAALADLQQMHAMGIEAVRTGWVDDDSLLALADSLGIQFYQDAPVAYLPAEGVRRELPLLREPLRQRLRQAEQHPSARHFGLGQMLDTSDPAACSAIEQLADYIRTEGPSGVEVYYVTPFIEADRCASAVDFVLLDALDTAPVPRIDRWRAHHPDVPAGIGRLGAWVDSTAASGPSVAYSAEAQARFLETHIPAARQALRGALLFVYRWQDQGADPYGRAYGVHEEDGTARPAAEVVQGIYTGRQTVFAFAAGDGPQRSIPWLIVIGWGAVLLLGWVYAQEPRFRHMTARYFRAHAFYQEAIRGGRDLLVGSTLVLLAAEVISVGVLGVVVGRQFRFDDGVVHALEAVPLGLREALATLIGTPWSLGLLVGAGYAVLLILWMLLLVFGSRWARRPLSADQGIVLVVWPRWPLLVLLGGALVASTLAPVSAQRLLAALVALFIGLGPLVVARTLIDYRKIVRVPGAVIALAVVLAPAAMALYIGAIEVWRNDVPLRFIWHLLTQT